MKRLSLFVVFALTALFLPTFAYATPTCPAPPAGPYFIGFYYWYDYTADIDCWQKYGDFTPSTLSCYSTPANEYGDGSTMMSYDFTASTGLDSWEADVDVDFQDPNYDWWNQVEMDVTVVHNGTPSYTQIFVHNGTMGDLSCEPKWGYFSAQDGDAITIEVRSMKWYADTMIKTSAPRIYNITP